MRVIGIILCLMLANGNAVESKLSPTVRLNNGYEMPINGLGTYALLGSDGERAIRDAIDIGYRHFDTAYLYGNEKEVGNAIRAKIADGTLRSRSEVFVTSKLWNTFHEPDFVEKAFQKSFDNLNLGYIDLYLMHSPISYQKVLLNNRLPADDVDSYSKYPIADRNGNTVTAEIDYIDTWRAMERLVQSGRVLSIGVSNFNSQQIDRLNSLAVIKPVTNQVECHPNLNQRKLINFSAQRGIVITAYSPLGRPNTEHSAGLRLAISEPKVLEIAKKYQKTPAQIILRYTTQNGAVVIPKSANRERIRQNFDIFDFTLSDSDMQTIHGINNNRRLIDPKQDRHSKYYPFHIEF